MKSLFKKGCNMKWIQTIASIFCLSVSITFLGCKDGEIGPAGLTGAKGDKGDKGDKGNIGSKGVGFDESVNYGGIKVYLKGTLLENILQDTIDFKYSPKKLEYSSFTSEGSMHSFNVARFSGLVNESYNYDAIEFRFERAGGDQTEVLNALSIYTDIKTSNINFFKVNIYWWKDLEYFSDFKITNYSFNAVTGKLKYHFSVKVNSENNSTQNELLISGDADLSLFENINVNQDL